MTSAIQDPHFIVGRQQLPSSLSEWERIRLPKQAAQVIPIAVSDMDVIKNKTGYYNGGQEYINHLDIAT